ncbi:MAG TPA: alpha/beta fold hydrolase [Acidimicrobiia bacterium]
MGRIAHGPVRRGMLAAVPELLTSDGVRLHYVVQGPETALPVVLLHGLGTDAEGDQPLADAVGDRLRTIRLDLRGHGRSEPLADPDRYGWFGRPARDVVELLDTLGLDTVALQGGSLGAAVAIATTLAAPGRILSLGLSSPAVGAGPDLGNPVAVGFASFVDELGLVGALDTLYESGALPIPADEFAAARASHARQDDASMRACVRALARAELVRSWSELAAIRCPTMLVAGPGDAVHPPAIARAIATHVPGAAFVQDDDPGPLALRPAVAADRIVAFHTAAATTRA